jgi:hypothetical protein
MIDTGSPISPHTRSSASIIPGARKLNHGTIAGETG